MSIGVALFFVISGYCISAASDTARLRKYSAYIFFSRRFRRIFPPYWVAVALTIPFVALIDRHITPGLITQGNHSIPSPEVLTAWQWAGNLTLTESWRFHLIGSTRAYFLGPAWTLCYEEQFYAVMGVLLLVASRRFYLATLLVTLLTVAVKIASRGFHFSVDGYFCDGYWLLFAAGILVYYRINYASTTVALCINVLFIVAIALVALNPLSVFGRGTIAYAFLLAGTVFALLLVGLHRWDSQVAHSRLLRPLTFCGQMCYSLYLVHWPIVKYISCGLYQVGFRTDYDTLCLTLPLCLLASLAAGTMFHLLIERRFLNKPDSRVYHVIKPN